VRVPRRRAEAATLRKFGASLLRRLPPADVCLYLHTSPSACLERAGAGAGLALADHEALHTGTREVVRGLTATGYELYTRQWDHFGKTAAVRDAVLCAPPPPAARYKAAPPSVEAVERILQDAWAAAESATTPRILPADDDALPSSVSSLSLGGPDGVAMGAEAHAEENAEIAPPLSPNPSACASREGCSPASVLTTIENMPTIRAPPYFTWPDRTGPDRNRT